MNLRTSNASIRFASLARAVCLGLLVWPLLASPASALQACLGDTDGNPLRRVWVEHFFTHTLTDEDGCFSMSGVKAPVEVRVYAQNPVVKMEDGNDVAFFNAVSQVVTVHEGATSTIKAKAEFFARAEEIRKAYENGLRSFSLWPGEFPTGQTTFGTPALIRAIENDQMPGPVRSFVEPKALGSDHPLIHFIPEEDTELDHDTVAHELGHALHFALLPPEKRERIQNDYLYWLAIDPEKFHRFGKRTMPMLAYLEAFGFFAADWEATSVSRLGLLGSRWETLYRTVDFYAVASDRGDGLTAFGDDVEGAVYMTLFHDFARSQGLDFVVEQFVTCESLDVQEFGHCIKQRFSAAVFQSLVAAGANWGIEFDADAPPVADSAQDGEHFGHATASGDFDGDGHLDLAIGVPDELVGSVRSGAVNVLYGTENGVRAERNQFWHMNRSGVPGVNDAGDRFGAALAAGDLNGDGFDDLAVGVPSDRVSNHDDAGQVVVLFGSANGLTGGGSVGLHQSSIGVKDSAEAGDQFGFALSIGDFNADGIDDLAVGVPFEDLPWIPDAGAVNVIFGTPGVLGLADQFFTENTSGIQGSSEIFDNMGWALAAGDFDGNGYDDLAIGIPNEDYSRGRVDAGQVTVIYGAANGLTTIGDELWNQNRSGIHDSVEAFDNFGQALAAGDFDADGRDDLAIGVPNEDFTGGRIDAGMVNVLYGTAAGLDDARTQRFNQNVTGIADSAEAFDNFGASLAAGDFDGNGRDDLAIGVPNEDLDLLLDAGAVTVLYASDTDRLTGTGSDFWHQTLPGFEGDPFLFDDFGRSLLSADFDGDGAAELAIGTPGDDVDAIGGAGSVEILGGDSRGLQTGNRIQRWHQNR